DLLIGIDSIPIIEKFSGKSEDFAKVTFKMGFLDKMVKISEKHDFCKKFLIGYLGTLAGLDDDMTLAVAHLPNIIPLLEEQFQRNNFEVQRNVMFT
ncbi:MAG: hypothetical protein EZS28_056460, partial [Streblomastix strix]